MGTFHPFSQLPAELRLQIWEMTVEPRVVEVRYHDSYRKGIGWRWILHSPTPIPAPLQTCREARNARLYERCFSEMRDERYSEQRYVWLNLDIDMVSIGGVHLSHFTPVAHQIKRLRFMQDNYCEWWSRGSWEGPGSRYLCNFVNVSEIQVALCKNGEMEDWHGASLECPWPCGPENVRVIDFETGEEMKLLDLEDKYDHIWTEIGKENGSNQVYIRGQVQ